MVMEAKATSAKGRDMEERESTSLSPTSKYACAFGIQHLPTYRPYYTCRARRLCEQPPSVHTYQSMPTNPIRPGITYYFYADPISVEACGWPLPHINGHQMLFN